MGDDIFGVLFSRSPRKSGCISKRARTVFFARERTGDGQRISRLILQDTTNCGACNGEFRQVWALFI